MTETTSVPALSSFASSGGCACKLGQDELRSILSQLPQGEGIGDLLVGHGTNDDAAVLRIAGDQARGDQARGDQARGDQARGDQAIVQTVDFFTPIVDDPYLFGAIAATNAISDVYAMGATPILGLAIAAFPTGVLPLTMLRDILRGGVDKAAEAGFPVAGGHTIIDDVPKYGLAVTGIVSVDKLVRNSTARPGQSLYLTKPIGNGVLVRAHRAGKRPDLGEAIRWMTMLNRDAAVAMVAAGVSAATDVTGYGLIGHLLEVCAGSGVGAEIRVGDVPVLDGARHFLEAGVVSGGTMRNADAFRGRVRSAVDERDYRLLCDAQTSGGLLMSVAPEREEALRERLRAGGLFYAKIGVTNGDAGLVTLVP